jgi:hypothetical protein
MASTYEHLLSQARTAHRYASETFHSDPTNQEIAAALDGFVELLRHASATRHQGGGRAQEEGRDHLLRLEAQFKVLQAAFASAAREGRRKIARAALLDRAKWTHRASIQQGADDELQRQIEALIGVVREDHQGPGRHVPGGREPTGRPPMPEQHELSDETIDVERINVEEFERELRKHEAPHEDELVRKQIDDIGGQRTEPAKFNPNAGEQS